MQNCAFKISIMRKQWKSALDWLSRIMITKELIRLYWTLSTLLALEISSQ